MKSFLFVLVVLASFVLTQTAKVGKYSGMSSEDFDSVVKKNLDGLESWENVWRDKEFTLADDRYNEEHEFPGNKPARSQEERAQKKKELDDRLSKIPELVRPKDADELLATTEELRSEILVNRSSEDKISKAKLDPEADSRIVKLKNRTGTRRDLLALVVYMRELQRLVSERR